MLKGPISVTIPGIAVYNGTLTLHQGCPVSWEISGLRIPQSEYVQHCLPSSHSPGWQSHPPGC